jgi:hypothetical protein
MPKLKKPSFEIVVGTSTKSPQLAAKDAEKKAKLAGGEQVSIAASVFEGAASTAAQDQLLNNIAKNIYQLVQCTCPTVIGQEIHKPGFPPPLPGLIMGTGTGGGSLWVVYILLRH